MLGYTEYLFRLARELGCGLRLEPNLAGMMFVEFGYVEGPHPDTSTEHTPQEAFAVGLHELGHFHHGHTQGRPPYGDQTVYFDRGVLRSEAEAWDYALSHFVFRNEELEPDTARFMWHTCLGSYFNGSLRANGNADRLWNGDRHHVQFHWDEPGPLFDTTRDRMLAAA